MCQSFNNFSGFLHHFVLAKLATTSIRVKARFKMSGDIVSCCEMGSNRVGLSFQELANGGD